LLEYLDRVAGHLKRAEVERLLGKDFTSKTLAICQNNIALIKVYHHKDPGTYFQQAIAEAA